jgi:O-methyltransferase StaMB
MPRLSSVREQNSMSDQSVTAVSDDVGKLYDRFGDECVDKGANEDAPNFGFGEHLHFGYWETPDEDVSLAVAATRLTDMVIDRVRVDHTHHVLDVGCGIGGPALRMARRTGARISGITVSRDQITQANEAVAADGLADQVDFQRADAMNMPFEDNSFDAVFALESIIHIPDRRQVLGEIGRVLRPGGRLVLTDFFERAPIPENKLPYVRLLLENSMMSTARIEDYPAMLRDAGMLFEEIVDISEHATRRTFKEMSKVWERANPDLGPEEALESWDPCPGMATVDEFGYLLLVAKRS